MEEATVMRKCIRRLAADTLALIRVTSVSVHKFKNVFRKCKI